MIIFSILSHQTSLGHSCRTCHAVHLIKSYGKILLCISISFTKYIHNNYIPNTYFNGPPLTTNLQIVRLNVHNDILNMNVPLSGPTWRSSVALLFVCALCNVQLTNFLFIIKFQLHLASAKKLRRLDKWPKFWLEEQCLQYN